MSQVNHRPMNVIVRRELRLLWAAGATDTDLATTFGVTRQTIRYHRRLLKLPSNRGRGRPRTVEADR